MSATVSVGWSYRDHCIKAFGECRALAVSWRDRAAIGPAGPERELCMTFARRWGKFARQEFAKIQRLTEEGAR